jgi:hypothetical protein
VIGKRPGKGALPVEPKRSTGPIPFKQLGGIEEARLLPSCLPSAIMGMKKIRRRWQEGKVRVDGCLD